MVTTLNEIQKQKQQLRHQDPPTHQDLGDPDRAKGVIKSTERLGEDDQQGETEATLVIYLKGIPVATEKEE